MNIVYMGYREDAQEYYESASASNANKASLSLEDGFSYNITDKVLSIISVRSGIII